MPKPEKIATVDEIKEKLDSAKIAILTEFQGLNVAEMTELRKLFRESDVEYKVYKNTLTRIAADQLGIDLSEYLKGTTALAFCRDDLVAPAKIVKDFGRTHGDFKVKVGILDKKVIASSEIESLAVLPPREVLLATVLNRMQSPLSGLMNVLQGTLRNFIFGLKNLAEQKGADGTADQQAEQS